MTCECGAELKGGAFWLRYGVRVATCQACGKTTTAPMFTESIRKGPAIQDDTLPGGARWMQNLGHQPCWIETKSELKRELAERGLEVKDAKNHNIPDKSPWATRTRLR